MPSIRFTPLAVSVVTRCGQNFLSRASINKVNEAERELDVEPAGQDEDAVDQVLQPSNKWSPVYRGEEQDHRRHSKPRIGIRIRRLVPPD